MSACNEQVSLANIHLFCLSLVTTELFCHCSVDFRDSLICHYYLKQLYLSLVRPHIEYGCQVWDPHLAKDKKTLEDVQKFGLRLASHRWDASYNELLDLFDL